MGNKDSWEKVGLTPDKRAAWLLNFGRVDYDALPERERERLRCELTAVRTIFLTGPTLWPGTKHLPFPIPANSLADAIAREYHVWLKQGLDSVLGGEKWKFPVTATYEIDLLRAAPGFWFYRIDPEATEETDLLRLMTFEIVRAAHKRLKQCPECRSLFFPRRQQRYCSSSCSQAARSRRWRESNPDHVRELRKEQYKRVLKRKKGMVKPTPRSRRARKQEA